MSHMAHDIASPGNFVNSSRKKWDQLLLVVTFYTLDQFVCLRFVTLCDLKCFYVLFLFLLSFLSECKHSLHLCWAFCNVIIYDLQTAAAIMVYKQITEWRVQRRRNEEMKTEIGWRQMHQSFGCFFGSLLWLFIQHKMSSDAWHGLSLLCTDIVLSLGQHQQVGSFSNAFP